MTTAVYSQAPARAGTRLVDYVRLTRPRLSALVLVTVAAGAVLASAGAPDWWLVAHAVVGAALVAAGASALNQLMERDVDARMRRTQDRPLPTGKVPPGEALVFGITLAVTGVVYLAVALPHPLAAVVTALTFLIYVFVYTPLKRRTPLNTLAGAIAGALPPVIGWTAVRGSVAAESAALFGILFLWQMPHFLAIAWIHRADYSRAGLSMLPSVDPEGRLIGRQMVGYSLALLTVSVALPILGTAGPVYLVGAVLLGVGFLTCAVRFACLRSLSRARVVLRASLIYLPGLLALLVLDGLRHG
jgi:protoheme IX farnesyltransferase